MNTSGEIIAFPSRRLAPAPTVHTPPSVEFDSPAVRSKERPGKLAPIKERWRTFRAALFRVEFLEAVRKARSEAELIAQYGDECSYAAGFVSLFGKEDLDGKLARAVADLALTPVTRKADLAEKRRVIDRHRFHLAVKRERIAAALAADEAYCALPRGKRVDAIKRKAVR